MRSIFLALLLLLASVEARAQAYPSKPVHIVITTPAGGLADLAGRVIADELRVALGQPFVIENRPGASGKVGTEYVARSAPDGYVLLFTNPSSHTLPTLNDPNPTFDPEADFAPIARTGTTAFFLVARPGFPAHDARGVVAFAKQNPGKLNFANNGPGTSAHFASVMFTEATGIDVLHVPYRGENPVSIDLMAGHVDVAFLSGAKPLVESGKLEALGVSTIKPFPSLPNVPPLADTGVPGFDFTGWHGMLAPAKTPPEIIAKLNAALSAMQNQPRFVKVLTDNGAAPVPPGPPDELVKAIHKDLTTFRRLVAEKKIKLD